MYKNFDFKKMCTFYCTQNDRLNLTVSRQKLVWKMSHPGLRYLQKCILTRCTKPNRQPKMFVIKYLSPDGRFEYNKRYKWSKKYVENSVYEPQILPQKPRIAEKLDLIGQNGYSFRYLWPLIEWNQVKYPGQHFLFFILFCSEMMWSHYIFTSIS